MSDATDIVVQRIYTVDGETGNLLAAVADWRAKRSDIPALYADLIIADCQSADPRRKRADWTKVNAAIIGRWSPTSLTWIKKRAWKMVGGIQHD